MSMSKLHMSRNQCFLVVQKLISAKINTSNEYRLRGNLKTKVFLVAPEFQKHKKEKQNS